MPITPPATYDKWLCFTILMVLLAFTPQTGQTALYSWVDADGVRHYTNSPPPENITAFMHSDETPYDAAADRERQAADERYFNQLALDSTRRRLDAAEQALANSQQRALAAERRAVGLERAIESYDTYPRGSYGYGGGYVYDPYDPYAGACEYDRPHHRKHWKDRADCRPKPELYHEGGGDRIAKPLPQPPRRGDHFRPRLSKRERGVTSGLYQVRRALPSPYYFGNRPVYQRRIHAGPRRGGDARPAHHRGYDDSGGAGVRMRISF
ncbi:MAG: DUF4124 domain-containing protein [Desulfosarcina sp.]|nr:DUF4124 domain-containing protein [Desulfobacterales bacterium]